MQCNDCREALNAYIDGELPPVRAESVRDHLAGCIDCQREYDTLMAVSVSIKESLVQYAAPAQLEDRIRKAVSSNDFGEDVVSVRGVARRWPQLVAAGLFVAVASSTLTYAIVQQRAERATVAEHVVSSHIRSLMPGHLTDVASNNLHNVKPWFAGRVDISPSVPSLDSAGFPLVGGRLDYVDGRAVAALVYMRRQHVINVYSWPTAAASAPARRLADAHGYHIFNWRNGGVELWAISDVDPQELERFVGLFK
jgi:anti-sigma factor (TIGR02949 family)